MTLSMKFNKIFRFIKKKKVFFLILLSLLFISIYLVKYFNYREGVAAGCVLPGAKPSPGGTVRFPILDRPPPSSFDRIS